MARWMAWLRMSGPKVDPDEFGQIEDLFAPLTRGAPGALGLLDDAAVIPSRPGWDLVVTKDAMVAGVHFLADEAPGRIAQRLMRANLSDLAAKGAEPFGYFLMTAWSPEFDLGKRRAFAKGLQVDGAEFDVDLLGGDTVSTSGPLTVSMTALGWVPAGKMVRRDSACVGDLIVVSGPIGEGWLDWGLGLGARLPAPRLDLRDSLRASASAAADISDGLIADAEHIAKASGLGLRIDLDKMPISKAAAEWVETQPDAGLARLRLATAGDDYELVCTVSPENLGGLNLTVVGEVIAKGRDVVIGKRRLDAGAGGWVHGVQQRS